MEGGGWEGGGGCAGNCGWWGRLLVRGTVLGKGKGGLEGGDPCGGPVRWGRENKK